MSDDSFKRFFKAVLQNLKAHMKDGIPPLGIPPLDPLSVGSFSFSEKESYVDVKASFQDVVVTGLSTIDFPKLSFDDTQLKVSATTTLANLKGTGKYKLDGTAVYIVPLTGDGDMTVEAEAVTMTISMTVSTFNIAKLTAKVTVEDISFAVGSIKLNLTNLEGGGDLGSVLNEILNLLGKKIFDAAEPAISHALESALQSIINEELKKLHLPAVLNTTSNPPTGAIAKAFYRPTFDLQAATPGNLNVLFDQILANANSYLAGNNYDPWNVGQDASTSFSQKMPWPLPSINGGAQFTDIEIYGLSHLVRTGDVTLCASPPTISLNIGVSNSVHGGGNWKAWLKPVNIHGSGNVSINNLSIAATITVQDKKGTIQSIGFSSTPNINVDINGLGPLSWILSQFINAITGMLSPWLNNIVMPKLKGVLQDELNKVSLPI